MNFRTVISSAASCFGIPKKVKGGALYVSILVSIIIGILLTFFILIGNYNQRTVTVFSQSSQLLFNLQSGFQMAQSAYFTSDQNYRWVKNQVNDDSIRVKKINWGAYIVLSSETKNRHQYLSQAGLYGTYMSPDTGLIVADNSRPVGLSGNVVFKANCYLPAAGIKPAYIEGQSYISAPGNSTFLKRSPGQTSPVDPSILKGLKEQQRGMNIYLDSSVSVMPEQHRQAFTHKTLVWQMPGTHLSHVRLRDNIKIVCGDVEIDSSSHLENILIVCNKARFKKGFRGKVHVIASDSISMDPECTFDYPSSFVLITEESGGNGLKYIYFNKECKFNGGVLAFSETTTNPNSQRVFVRLQATSEINGFVYCSDYIHMEGMVNATVIASKLLLQTPSASYENHILSCEINPGKYAHLMAVPPVFKQRPKLLCCQVING